MLKFHILNVGKGNSTIVEYINGENKAYALIDSNNGLTGNPVALAKLQALGAQELSFVAMSHPHKDHYSGLFEVLAYYDRSVHDFFTGPMGDLLSQRSRLKALASTLQKLRTQSDSTSVRKASLELMQIIRWASESTKWTELVGDFSLIAPFGFTGVQIATIVPQPAVKGKYIQRISSGEISLETNEDENAVCIAFQFDYGGKRVLLSGDATVENWRRRRRFEENSGNRIGADLVNMPHHGSKKDCPPDVLEQIFKEGGRTIAIISANGTSHPSSEVLQDLEQRGRLPYCTNLKDECGANVKRLIPLVGYEPEFARFIRESLSERRPIVPCQGDITISISSCGDLSIDRQFATPCPFRGELGALDGLFT